MSMSDLQHIISERIQRDGPITFAEYMRMALYEPEYGYYVTGAAKMGWEADYFTSTDVSSLFANCLGRQLFAMWEKLKRPGQFIVLEQGAGRGHLAEGVRYWAQKAAPEFYEVLEYRTEDIREGADAIEEPLPLQEQPIQGQPFRGREQAPPLLYTNEVPISQDDIEEAKPEYSRGDPRGRPVSPSVVLSNELVDAFPVHIVEKRDELLYEVFVDVQQDGRFCEVLGEPSKPEVAGYLDRYKIPWRTFEDGWRAEVNLDALRWMQRTAGSDAKRFCFDHRLWR